MKINPQYVEVTVASSSDPHRVRITADRNYELNGECLWGKINWSKFKKFPKDHLILFPKSKAFLIKRKGNHSKGIIYWSRYLIPIKDVLAIDRKLKPGEY